MINHETWIVIGIHSLLARNPEEAYYQQDKSHQIHFLKILLEKKNLYVSDRFFQQSRESGQ
jgi:hypothetical protein